MTESVLIPARAAFGRALEARELPRDVILCAEHHLGVVLDDRGRFVAVVLFIPAMGQDCFLASFAGDLAPPVRILYRSSTPATGEPRPGGST